MADGIETATAESEGTDGSDKPPHAGNHSKQHSAHRNVALTKGSAPYKAPASDLHLSAAASSYRGESKHSMHAHSPTSPHHSIPLPPPETGALPKEPGLTKGDLGQLILQQVATQHVAGSETPSSLESPADSETDGDSWPPSAPSTRPNTRPNSRAPSMSEERPRKPSFSSHKSTERQITHSDTVRAPVPIAPKEQSQPLASPAPSTPTPTPAQIRPVPPSRVPSQHTPSRPPSVHSDGGHKFTLKDLLANGPKLHRRSSARSSASSKKSDSDGDRRSTAGDSTVSLSKKYGVCERLAIGKGATSIVRLAHKWDRLRSAETLYAVKEFRKKKKNETEKEYVKKLTAEFCISSTLHHVNIVETVDLVQDENKHWCEVMEFCPGGDLYAAIKKGGMSPSEVECCFKQILTGVQYLHSQGVAHRDIKPENLFFNAHGQLKIGDYGASTVYRLPWELTVHMSTGLCGSEPYIAPEQFTNKPYDARLVDIWACGIVYYCLHFQELPWRIAQHSDALYASYAQACASASAAQSACPPTINNLSPRECRPLLRKMLEPDPKQRWTIEEVTSFPWIQKIEVCHLVPEPKHIHVCARQLADAQAREVATAAGVGLGAA